MRSMVEGAPARRVATRGTSCARFMTVPGPAPSTAFGGPPPPLRG